VWEPGRIVRATGPVSYEIAMPDRGTIKRRVDQIRKRYCDDIGNNDPDDLPDQLTSPSEINEQADSEIPVPVVPREEAAEPPPEVHEPPPAVHEPPPAVPETQPELRRSARIKTKPSRLIETKE